MIKRVFIDTDIILDVALARKPFVEASRLVLSIMENNIADGKMSSNCVANIYYILRKAGGDKEARTFLEKIIEYISIISIDHSNVVESLKSKFNDFEDGLQYFSALRNQCDCIVTRNVDDYQYSEINVYSPTEYLSLYQGKL
jgi:predicted nucleic acid-binding protein